MVEKIPDDEPGKSVSEFPKEKEKVRVNVRKVEMDDHFNEYPLDGKFSKF